MSKDEVIKFQRDGIKLQKIWLSVHKREYFWKIPVTKKSTKHICECLVFLPVFT